jgi:PAS domain-containing protein
MPAKDQTVITPKQTSAIRTATEQMRALYGESQQAMYLFLDDHNKSCNPRFAKLLGYADPATWAAVQTSFPQAFVAPKSQGVLIDAYQAALQDGVATKVPVTWKRKDGKTVDTNVILVPVDVDGNRLALHFIDEA